jgi:hypothetical protein
MTSNLFNYLKHEQQLLIELVALAEKQQKALIKYDTSMLDEIASYQNVVVKSLRQAEEHRINLLMSWLGITRIEASSLKLSALDKYFKNEELKELKSIRTELKKLMTQLQSLNSLNRVLTNRAKNSVREMLSNFTNNNNFVCNVRV